MFNVQKRFYAVVFAACWAVVATATDRYEQLADNVSSVIAFTQDGFLGNAAMAMAKDHRTFHFSPEDKALGVLWAAQYMPKTKESRREGYNKKTLAESFGTLGLDVKDEGDGYLRVRVVRPHEAVSDNLLGVTLLLNGDWPHLKDQSSAHRSLLENCRYSGGSQADVSMSAKHFPVAFSMRELDKLKDLGSSLDYGSDFDSAYCVGLLRDLLTFSLTRTKVLAGVSKERVVYKVEEIKVMMRKLMSYMKGSISEGEFVDFCGERFVSVGLSAFEKGLYAGLEMIDTAPIMEEKDERVITEVWEVVERGIKEGLPVEDIKSWGRKLDDLFEKLGKKAGVDIPKGVYGPQFGAWLDYMANGKGLYRILPQEKERALQLQLGRSQVVKKKPSQNRVSREGKFVESKQKTSFFAPSVDLGGPTILDVEVATISDKLKNGDLWTMEDVMDYCRSQKGRFAEAHKLGENYAVEKENMRRLNACLQSAIMLLRDELSYKYLIAHLASVLEKANIGDTANPEGFSARFVEMVRFWVQMYSGEVKSLTFEDVRGRKLQNGAVEFPQGVCGQVFFPKDPAPAAFLQKHVQIIEDEFEYECVRAGVTPLLMTFDPCEIAGFRVQGGRVLYGRDERNPIKTAAPLVGFLRDLVGVLLIKPYTLGGMSEPAMRYDSNVIRSLIRKVLECLESGSCVDLQRFCNDAYNKAEGRLLEKMLLGYMQYTENSLAQGVLRGQDVESVERLLNDLDEGFEQPVMMKQAVQRLNDTFRDIYMQSGCGEQPKDGFWGKVLVSLNFAQNQGVMPTHFVRKNVLTVSRDFAQKAFAKHPDLKEEVAQFFKGQVKPFVRRSAKKSL